MTKLTAANLARWINDYIPTRGDPNRYVELYYE
jgi:hypothetical protein